MTQRDLAFPGCTAAYISRIEHGARVPSLQILREFASRLGVAESYLAHGTDERTGAELWAQAKAALRLNELEAARELADAILDGARDDRARARASAVLGQVALFEGDHDAAVDALERARLLDPELEVAEPEVAERLGRAYARRSEYESAIAVFLRNLERARSAGSPVELTRFGSLLANAYVDSGDFAGAEAVLAEVLKEADGIADPVARARVLWTQSRVRTLQQDPEAAARYAQQAVEILEVADQDYYAALGYQLLAHIELDRGNAARALELLERGGPLIAARGRPFELAAFRLEHVRALLRTGRREEAASQAMGIAPLFAEGQPIDSGRTYVLLAEVFAELGEEERAIELYELAIERFRSTGGRYVVEAYTRLAELLEARGREGDALQLLKRAMHVQRAAGRLLAETGD